MFCFIFVQMEISTLNIESNPLKVEEADVLTIEERPCTLIIWNDDENTFDWVIDTLVEVCSQTEEQAEQCAMIIHLQGKYAVKHGDYDTLKPMCNSITDRGIGATIEVPVD